MGGEEAQRIMNRLALWFGVLVLAAACGEGESDVIIDLCPGRLADDADTAPLERADHWEMTVWGVYEEDAVWHRSWAGSGSAEALSLQAALPVNEEVRITVEGWGTAADSQRRLFAIAGSGVIELTSGIRICLCTAQPERYDELCPQWWCTFNVSNGACWQ